MQASRDSGDQQKQATETDTYIARQLRTARKLGKLSQEQLAERVGVTFQQIQKYESGANRISASRLYQIARVLNQPVSFFLPAGAERRRREADAHPDLERLIELLRTPDTMALHAAYIGIPDPELRRRVLALVRSIASDPG